MTLIVQKGSLESGGVQILTISGTSTIPGFQIVESGIQMEGIERVKS